VSGRGQQIGDAVAHQAAPDHADGVLSLLLHALPDAARRNWRRRHTLFK
jgi:hypothetical protein